MLQAMRSHAGSWFIKLLLGAIVASFALWGIADIIRGYGHNRPVATVGDQTITVEEMRHIYKQTISRFQQMTKSALTPEQIKSLNLSSGLLETLVKKALAKEDIHHKGLVIDDQRIRHEIYQTPELMTKQGTFNHEMFQNFLRAQGISESMFVQDMRMHMQKHQFFYSLSMGLRISSEYARILLNALEQPYQFVSALVPFKAMPAPTQISPDDLAAFYSKHAESFRRPEYRKLTLLCFDRSVLKKTLVVSADEVEAAYQERMDAFKTPEKRRLEAIILASNEAARKAVDQLALGKPIKAVARDLEGSHKDLGIFSKADFGASRSDDMTDAVFSLSVGGVSKPFDVANGWIIFYVSEIQPAVETSKEEARAKVESDLKDERLNDYIEKLQNQVEDDLASGSKPLDVAQKYDLVLKSIPLIRQDGRSEDGLDVLDAAIQEDVLEYAFKNNEGTESPFILAQHKNDASGDANLMGVIVHIDRVQPSHIPALKDIEPAVRHAFITDAQIHAAQTIAENLRKGVTSVEALKKNSASHKGVVFAKLPVMSRSSVDNEKTRPRDITTEALESLFALPKGETLLDKGPTGYRVIMLESILPHTTDAQKAQAFEKKVSATLEGDLENQYYHYLRAHAYSVSINASQLAHATGEEDVEEKA